MRQNIPLRDKVILLKASLLELEHIANNTDSLQEIRQAIEDVIVDELNDPSKEDVEFIFRLRDRTLKSLNKKD
jgi:hypothetical protein